MVIFRRSQCLAHYHIYCHSTLCDVYCDDMIRIDKNHHNNAICEIPHQRCKYCECTCALHRKGGGQKRFGTEDRMHLNKSYGSIHFKTST